MFAIRVGQSYWNTSTSTSWVSDKATPEVWSTRESAQGIVDHWLRGPLDPKGKPRHPDWYCYVGRPLHAHRMIDEKMESHGLPEVVEVESGKLNWFEHATLEAS